MIISYGNYPTNLGLGRIKPIFKELNILDVKNSFYLETCKFMYKFKNNLLPVRMANYFTDNNENFLPSNHAYALRPRKHRFTCITTRLVSGEKSIQIRGEKVWVNIPDEIKNHTSFVVFKREIKLKVFD